ncbi:phosphonate ABC transporter substrate-binding protein [Palleronia sediminis]|uniref:Phosphonate ABC transporter substrate-binding protein n=1 Tax=Palleronia sediminis TaxID=2547833 RepID=A0A4R6ANU5_9RHOB|nr:substrate-binding domain-containing protein [Palleronia sediminis]TDL83626.1 phosphonate ABC transporter substrate-binding protein [Palleronia sediminis]
MPTLRIIAPAIALAALATGAAVAQGREQVQVAGSSTVLPYANIAAEYFGENFDFPTPIIQAGGSSAGLKLFCQGLGETTVDIANSSRPMRESERAVCIENGVTDIIEVRLGYDGIVFASQTDGPDFADFEAAQWYRAMAAELPRDGTLVPNPYTRWSEIDARLPDVPITAFIPGTKHGTREVFEEKVLLHGCEASSALEEIAAIMGGDEDAAEAACMAVRDDGRAVDIDGDYTETLARIEANPDAVGVFGLSFYENNTDKLRVATMGGVVPSTETIASGEYPVSRPLFFYVKGAHIGVIPGLKEFAAFFVHDQVAGPGGPLADYGLVPDPALSDMQARIETEESL